MAYIIWRIFLKQYASLRLGSAAAALLRQRFADIESHQAYNNNESSKATPTRSLDGEEENSRADSAKLTEVLVACDTQIGKMPLEAPAASTATIDDCSTENHCAASDVHRNIAAQAPIACEEQEDDGDFGGIDHEEVTTVNEIVKEATPLNAIDEVAAVQSAEKVAYRSKSRMCTYLKRCKDRLTGNHHHHHHSQQQQMETRAGADIEATSTMVVPARCPNETILVIAEQKAVFPIPFSGSTFNELHGSNSTVAEKEKEVNDLPQSLQTLREQKQLSFVIQMGSGIDGLIDRYLSSIYPFYKEATRAILIHQARDLLVCSYHGCLQAFEEKFLQRFTKIAAELRNKHAIGESLLWCQGWPLTTHTGAVVLHLGCLDDALLRPADIYLCVKSADKSLADCNSSSPTERVSPQLYAVWRSSESEAGVRSQRIDYKSAEVFLSTLTLEMLNDELPQLLQNLLVGVERTIDRISLNELQMTAATATQLADETKNNNKSQQQSLAATCALRRSELITKNHNKTPYQHHKYMLRRLTNRQDSMNSTSSGNSCGSSGSTTSSGDELLASVGSVAQPAQKPTLSTSTSPALPLFCLGNSFPHIDSDEDTDEKRNALDGGEQFENDIIPPRSINDIPEKLLNSGIYLPGTRDLKGQSILTIDAEVVADSGLNCYEVATILLFYTTISEGQISIQLGNGNVCNTQSTAAQQQQQQQQLQTNAAKIAIAHSSFTILIAIERSEQLGVVDLIWQSLKLLTRQIAACEIFAICLDRQLLQLCKSNDSITSPTILASDGACNELQKQQQAPEAAVHLLKFISVGEVTTSVVAGAEQLPYGKLQGGHHHDARKWRQFFMQLEPFQRLCTEAGHRLVTAMSDIRSADLQGLPTRRQLYGQHRALSRALMDSELHNLRKRGKMTLIRLHELGKSLSGVASNTSKSVNSNKTTAGSDAADGDSCNYSFITNNSHNHSSTEVAMNSSTTDVIDNNNSSGHSDCCNIDVAVKLQKVTLLFNEVDRVARRLEQLTEQRRERLRELTRQRVLEDEITEVTSWITNDGNEMLQRYGTVPLDCESDVKEHEQEFEKYYFISMKHLAKGRDLHDAAANTNALHESAINLKTALDRFAEKLERARERIEGAARLHHLLCLHVWETGVQQEMQRLAEKIGVTEMLQKYRQQQPAQIQTVESHQPPAIPDELQSVHKVEKANNRIGNIVQKPYAEQLLYSSTSTAKPPRMMVMQRHNHRSSLGTGSYDGGQGQCHCWRESRNLEGMDEFLHGDDDEEDGEEEQSKVADSGVGSCDRCEGNPQLTRSCSCQSLNENGNIYDKNDELDDEGFERPSKAYLHMQSPMEANAHLQCHASSLELATLEELSNLDPKIQKTLLLIMREMIGTERDYVRSLYYVIENYVDELLRDDIPQPLRGQRNVIFGNIEKIFEFHNSHFLSELERYERNPLKVGAAFLEMESKFYLYALYNKNKPKSDTLMSEYGTAFFKSKQFELNDKMDLASYLLKPVQRMGKYALLLQQLVKACNSNEGVALQEIVADVEELQRAEEMVKFQLRHGNDLLAMDSLRDCDVNVKEQGRLLRQNEFLVWQGRGGKKTLRQVFLFEELVLFSKARRFPDHKNLDIYIYKNSMKTSDIGLTAHVGDSPTKFEIWFRKRKPDDTWTLQCMSEDIKNAWTEEISKLLWKQAKRNREIRLAEMSSMGIGSKPCLDIRPSHNQISDRSITFTQLGKTPKLRHSFASLQSDLGKCGNRRPNSLILSESSLSSGTSSSSLSTGSTSGHERLGNSNRMGAGNGHHAALELINEMQTLNLSNASNCSINHNNNNNNNNNSTMSSNSSGTSGEGCGGNVNLRNHKRSTTLVSQLSMESGILSDISMTPDQEENADLTGEWSPTTVASAVACATSSDATATAILRRQKNSTQLFSGEEVPVKVVKESNIGSNPYLKDTEETINM